MEKTDLKSLPLDQLEQWVLEHGEKKFRAKQLYQWMHVKLADDLEQMSNLPVKLRDQISENCTFTVLKQVTMQESAIDGTRKYLFELEDHNMVESVLMRYQTRQFRLHFLSGWAAVWAAVSARQPLDGCGAKPDSRRKCWSRFTGSSTGYRRACFQCCGHGNRRTAG